MHEALLSPFNELMLNPPAVGDEGAFAKQLTPEAMDGTRVTSVVWVGGGSANKMATVVRVSPSTGSLTFAFFWSQDKRGISGSVTILKRSVLDEISQSDIEYAE